MKESIRRVLELATDAVDLNAEGWPECSCCGVELEQNGTGHRRDCLANAVLEAARDIEDADSLPDSITQAMNEGDGTYKP